MILGPNTVVYPGAVVVIPVNTTIADVAVPRSWSPDDLAVGTEGSRLVDAQKVVEVEVLVLFEGARVFEHRGKAKRETERPKQRVRCQLPELLSLAPYRLWPVHTRHKVPLGRPHQHQVAHECLRAFLLEVRLLLHCQALTITLL